MKEIINKIFSRFDFKPLSDSDEILFYENSLGEKQSYFIVHFVNTLEIRNYLDGDSISKPLELFEQHKKLKSDVEKNTSLIVVLQVDDLSDGFISNKNHILDVEEDEFWFKKYVLTYSTSSIANILETDDAYSQIERTILNNVKFAAFKENMFSDIEYFMCMQVFLKLPFLSVPVSLTEHYLSINDILKDNFNLGQFGYLDRITEEINNMDDNYWINLRAAALDTSENEQLDLFFTTFKAND